MCTQWIYVYSRCGHEFPYELVRCTRAAGRGQTRCSDEKIIYQREVFDSYCSEDCERADTR